MAQHSSDYQPPRLESIDDLLTDEERAELTADLARIHKTMYPCWEDRP